MITPKQERKQEIIYNFAELYYIFFINKMERINDYMTTDLNYPMALSFLTQRFNELNYTIKSYDITLYDRILSEIHQCKVLIEEFEDLTNNRKINRKLKVEMLRKSGHIIGDKINALYMLIMEGIDRMNMLLKKGEIDNTLAVYKM